MYYLHAINIYRIVDPHWIINTLLFCKGIKNLWNDPMKIYSQQSVNRDSVTAP